MNHLTIIGNLTRDPVLRTTPNGHAVCSFGVAVNRRRKAEGQPDADFFTVTAWRALAENCAKYLEKGRKCAVVGAVSVRTYEGQDGVTRASLEVTADAVEFLSRPEEGGQAAVRPAPAARAPSGDYGGFTQVDEEELPF